MCFMHIRVNLKKAQNQSNRGKKNKFQKAIALLFIMMYNYSAK